MKPKDQKRTEAEQRQKLRDYRGDQAQLDRLRKTGHADCKEAKRLEAKVAQDIDMSKEEVTNE